MNFCLIRRFRLMGVLSLIARTFFWLLDCSVTSNDALIGWILNTFLEKFNQSNKQRKSSIYIKNKIVSEFWLRTHFYIKNWSFLSKFSLNYFLPGRVSSSGSGYGYGYGHSRQVNRNRDGFDKFRLVFLSFILYLKYILENSIPTLFFNKLQ